MQCPRCDVPLRDVEMRQGPVFATVSACDRCKGQWFDAGKLDDLAEVIEIVLVEFRRIPPHDEQMTPLVCPRCPDSVWMQKVESDRDAKVIMDVCGSCRGTWLDGGELRAIQQDGLITAVANLSRWLRES